jgi:flagellar hook-associated protein 2
MSHWQNDGKYLEEECMPVTLGGVASGVDTEDIIKKLVNVESQQAQKAQRDKGELQVKKKALQGYGVVLGDLQKTVKELYGFRSSYDEKKGLSSNPSVLEAIATKNAEKGSSKVKVTTLASSHKISTDPVDASVELPAGQFDIEVGNDNRSVKFRGGNIVKFKEKLDEAISGITTISDVNTDGSRHVVALESKTSGKNGEIKIKGDRDFLKSIGLVKGEKDETKDKINLVFDNKYFSAYNGEQKPETQDGSLAVSEDGKSLTMGGVLWQEYTLPVPVEVKKNSVLQLNMTYQPPKKEEGDDGTLPYKVETGPDMTTIIKGIELHGYKISRERELDQKPKKTTGDDIVGVGVVVDENGSRKEKIYKIAKDSKGLQEFPVGADFDGKKISRVIFYCNDGQVKYADGSIATPLDRKGLLDPKNVISDAKDAKLKVDGVEITRSKNDGISDVIKGVTLNLKGVNDKDEVVITIDNDIAASVKKINAFIDAYNKYLDATDSLTRTSKMAKPGDYEKLKSESGLFVGDMMIIRLENQMKILVGAAFPSRVERPIKTLPQVGINTGKINAAWESIKEGKLQLEEGTLKEAIINNPDGVKDLFGSDNDGDNRIDNGFAYNMENALEPYVRPGKNLITAKIELQDDSIKQKDEFIAKQGDHLKTYEEKLRRKFSSMEKSVSNSKSQQNWMKSQMNSGQ